ncbi:methyltransferase domain-containing protein [Duganella sp. CT11-25]|uniref:methyltransferase domain-containing protein n=1 Tax=unclassified Duganella TaxID=2636909 RepID=UPI0039B0F093
MSAAQDTAAAVLIPPQPLRFMGETEDNFLPISDGLAANVLKRIGGDLTADLLDVGCGYGRLAYGLRRAGFRGSYRGFDILPEHIDWLRQHFDAPPDGERYRFDFVNVHNARYNPGGLPFEALELPYAGCSFDCITTFSVFTHMYEDDVRQYLRRIGQLLRDGGSWIVTFFSLPEGYSLAAQHHAMRYPLTQQISEHAYIHNPAEPLHVIAYEEAFLRRLFAAEGLTVAAHQPGSWLADPHHGEFQDWFVLRKQAAAVPVPAPATIEPEAPPQIVCNICGGGAFGPGPAGRMSSTGLPPHCRQCGALERHRLVRHLFQALPIGFLDWRRALQFSPDQGAHPGWFRQHEISVYGGENSLDIQAIARADGSYDFITLSHVLECIPNDLAAFDELHRVLSPRGLLHICFGRPLSRERSQDFERGVDRYDNLHLYGRDVYQRFGCAAKQMGMLVIEGSDPVTGAHDAVHLFARHAPDIALLSAWLRGWNGSLRIVDEVMP